MSPEVVKKQFGMLDEKYSEIKHSLDIVGLSLLIDLFTATWRSGTVLIEWQTG